MLRTVYGDGRATALTSLGSAVLRRVPSLARVATSLLIVAVLTVVLLGSFRRDVIGDRLWRIGFQQSWDVYAPVPLRRSQVLEAVITYADGTQSTWRAPRADNLSAIATHRWERWSDSMTGDGSWRWWEKAARWIARTQARPGKRPIKVVLRRRFADVAPPGRPETRKWRTFEFYTLPL